MTFCQAETTGGMGVGLLFGARVEDVRATEGESDQCFVVLLLLSSCAVVVGAGHGTARGAEGGREHRSFEDLVAAAGGCSPVDPGPPTTFISSPRSATAAFGSAIGLL